MRRTNTAAALLMAMAGLASSASASIDTMRIMASPGEGPASLGRSAGRGKNKARHHDNGGTRAYQRAAKKRRNVLRHRKACRS